MIRYDASNTEYNKYYEIYLALDKRDEVGIPVRAIGTLRDITWQKNTETELYHAKEAALSSDKLKYQFLSNMSHEIRTPLNAIIGFSDMLTITEDPLEKEQYATIIKHNNDLLLQLITDILDLSKIEADTFEFAYGDIDVNKVIQEVEINGQRKIKENIPLTITFIPALENCLIHTEGKRFRQIILNLVSNAIKFTKEGKIEIGYKVREKDMLFYVSDTGKGIPKEKQEEVFERFTKLDNFTCGTGLGLPICKAIITKLRGEMGVYSEPGKGSTFWFILPIQPLKKNTSIETDQLTLNMKSLTRAKEKPTLLIAEDEKDNYRLYEILLREYSLLHAWDGCEAIELFEKYERTIDAIIMDIKMPRMDGFQTIEKIRNRNNKIPIIAASAYEFSDDVSKIKNYGFNTYISKPLNKTALLTVLNEVLV
ncbi:MAG: ATP-binding protein [Bacteroides sp.]|nr:ATP-binding protein [Bacteroides sp.]